jgi:hypothetical protein
MRQDPLFVSWGRAARGQSGFYEETADDPQTGSLAVQILLAAAFVGALQHILDLGPRASGDALVGLLVGWVVLLSSTYYLGVHVHGGQPEFGGLARNLAYAMAPNVLLVLGVAPAIGPVVALVVWGWLLLTTTVASRTALSLTTSESLQATMVGWIAVCALPVLAVEASLL